MKISILCLGLNLIFALTLVWRFRQGGLALANTLSAVCNVFLLFRALRRKLGELELVTLKQIIFKLLIAVILAGAATWGSHLWWEQRYGHVLLWQRLGEVFLPMTIATIVYGLVTWWAKVPAAKEIGGLVLERLKKR